MPIGGCGRRSSAPFHCFRIVIYNERRNSNVLTQSCGDRALATELTRAETRCVTPSAPPADPVFGR
jgi:hypothetical protein